MAWNAPGAKYPGNLFLAGGRVTQYPEVLGGRRLLGVISGKMVLGPEWLTGDMILRSGAQLQKEIECETERREEKHEEGGPRKK